MATLSDVAKKANVSKMTVSRVINHPEKVTPELKALVLQAMEELAYSPNMAAKALATNRSQIIQLLILEEIDTTEPYYTSLLLGIAKQIGAAQYALQLVTKEAQPMATCDGYIIMGHRESDSEWLLQLEKPAVFFGGSVYGFDYVDSDNYYGTTLSTNHAMTVGYERIVYIGINEDAPFELERERGYCDYMKQKKKEPTLYRLANQSTLAQNFIVNHWQEFSKNTCFICSSDRLAIGIEQGILEMRGSIPNDYGIIGFDGVFLDQVASPKLTTVKQPLLEMGEALGRMLLKKIQNQGIAQGHQLFLPDLIVRESTK